MGRHDLARGFGNLRTRFDELKATHNRGRQNKALSIIEYGPLPGCYGLFRHIELNASAPGLGIDGCPDGLVARTKLDEAVEGIFLPS